MRLLGTLSLKNCKRHMGGQKQITQKNNIQIVQNVLSKSVIDKVFLKDYKKAFVYKKTEKLSRATHLVLLHSQQKRGVTDTVGLLSTSLIGQVLRGAESEDHLHKAQMTILEIISLLEVGGSCGAVPAGNAETLAREYGFLLATLCEVKPLQEHDLDLEVEKSEVHIPQTKVSKRVTKEPSGPASSPAARKDISPTSSNGSEDRKHQILSFLKDKGHASIKDISKVVPEVSEKTIQRELNKLISKGHVQKRGERRWSTYHFVV